MIAQPFTIAVAQELLDDLQRRLAYTRWPDQVAGAGWDYGTNLEYLKELVAYWRHTFDWRAQEAQLNRLAQFRAELDGVGVHFVHERGVGPNPLPLMLLHGWPDSFYRFYKVIPMLTDPARFGGDPADAFDVVVPSLAGFGFSDRPQQRGGGRDVELLPRLMSELLGYKRFGVNGGDTGSPLAQSMAFAQPEAILGLHLTDIGYDKVMQIDPATFSEAEQAYAQYLEQWQFEEGAYITIQGTKPQSLAYGLNDSPAGLAAWIVEQFRKFSDCAGEIERRFTKDELLSNIMIYWATETMSSAMRGYYEGFHAQAGEWGGEAGDEQSGAWGQPQAPQRLDVPVGLALFPKDAPAPREMAERFFDVQRWTEMPQGGHFAALEEPELFVEDVRAFFRPLRASN